MPVEVIPSRRRQPRIAASRFERRAARMLAALGRGSESLCIVLTTDPDIRRLNARYRDEDHATDVLAFPAGDPIGESAPALLGDVVISTETAARQARARGVTLLEEATFLLAHGVLHLTGLDHRTDREEALMNAETRRLVRAAKRGETQIRRRRA